jgi:uncharacterized membrane protein YheB (UPF0754 family)
LNKKKDELQSRFTEDFKLEVQKSLTSYGQGKDKLTNIREKIISEISPELKTQLSNYFTKDAITEIIDDFSELLYDKLKNYSQSQ